jgi:hypothetical protein
MIALLIALSFAAHASTTNVQRCRRDAQRVQALDLRIARALNPQAEVERLESRLRKAILRAHRDCGAGANRRIGRT